MFTPQEIQEQTFSKAVFGGYDMQQVDDFLEPLTDDYITLYKENSVLKAKMKILVEKLEEYRAQETKQSTAAADAEAKSAQLLKETQARCAAMLQNAEVNAQANAQVNAANVQLAQLNQQLHAEQERLDYAKQTALNFISVVERDIQGHLELLETLKARDLTREAAPAQPQPAHEKPYDWQAEQPAAPAAPAPAPSEDAEKIATEISDNLEKLIGSDSGAETKTASAPALSKQSARPMHPESATIKFEDLFESRPFLVFLGDDELHVRCDRPLYADRLIVPCKSALVTRMIEIGALVGKLCLVGENDKAVCETFRNVELFLVLCGELNTEPLSVCLGMCS